MKLLDKVIINTDGASRNNPGKAGIGVTIRDEDDNIIQEVAEYIGEATNNQAEYLAVIRALEEAVKLGSKRVVLHTDSQLVARQVGGQYKVRTAHLKSLWDKVMQLLKCFQQVDVFHISRNDNRRADRLANRAINNEGNWRLREM